MSLLTEYDVEILKKPLVKKEFYSDRAFKLRDHFGK